MKHAVLVVEDHRALRDGMVRTLDREGFVAIPAANGLEALEYLRSGGRPSVILLDLTMPGMDGWKFRQVQEHDPQIAAIPIIVLSGYSSAELSRHGGFPGQAAAFLEKPFSPAHLVSVVREIVHHPSSDV
jgi:CheY-like chemotaxis protein